MEEFSVKGDGGKYHEMKAQYLIIEKSWAHASLVWKSHSMLIFFIELPSLSCNHVFLYSLLM